MPIWRGSEVTAEPEILLRDWRIMETEREERHFVGARVDSGTGRVSSAIKNVRCSQNGRYHEFR